MIHESAAGQYFNNVWWQNDPDVLYLRDWHIRLSEEEVRSIALWDGIMGGSINTSDRFHKLRPDRLALWRFLQPGPERWTARLPYWTGGRKLRVAVRAYRDAGPWAVLALNPAAEPVTERLAMAELIGLDKAHCCAWSHEGSQPLGELDALLPQIAPHASALYYVARSPAPPPKGMTLGGLVAGK